MQLLVSGITVTVIGLSCLMYFRERSRTRLCVCEREREEGERQEEEREGERRKRGERERERDVKFYPLIQMECKMYSFDRKIKSRGREQRHLHSGRIVASRDNVTCIVGKLW